MPEQAFLLAEGPWVEVKDGNATAMSLFRRHYSARETEPKVYQFIGPGDKLPLLTPCARALFVWRKFISDAGENGVNCAVFRNEGAGLSSQLIKDASDIAWNRWPGERLYTYVDPRKLHTMKRRGRECCPYPPGRCFIEAGWQFCGKTKGGKWVFENRRIVSVRSSQ